MSELLLRSKHNYARERVTVSTTAIGCTPTTLRNSSQVDGAFRASAIVVEVITNTVWYTTDGSTPTSSNGNKLTAGDVVTLAGFQKLADFQMVRDGGSDATVDISYYY